MNQIANDVPSWIAKCNNSNVSSGFLHIVFTISLLFAWIFYLFFSHLAASKVLLAFGLGFYVVRVLKLVYCPSISMFTCIVHSTFLALYVSMLGLLSDA